MALIASSVIRKVRARNVSGGHFVAMALMDSSSVPVHLFRSTAENNEMASPDGNEVGYSLAVSTGIVVLTSGVSYVVAAWLPFYEGGKLVTQRTLSRRLEAMDRLLLLPWSVAICSLAVAATYDAAFASGFEERWTDVSPATRWCLSLYCSKTAVDIVIQVAAWPFTEAKRYGILAHHIGSVIAIGYGLVVSHQCTFWGCLATITETSTIFLNNVMAAKLFTGEQTPTQRLFVAINGIFLWLSYILCRLTLLPFWLYRFASDLQTFDHLRRDISLFQLLLYPGTVLAIFLLSCYWFLLITRGLLRAIRGGAKPAASRSSKKVD